MRLSMTLSLYIARMFITWVGGVLFAFLAIIVLLDVVELLRRAAGQEAATLRVIVEMAFLKLPNMAEKILPFAILFGAILTFWRLTRNHELIVVRAAGVSVWQFLLPAIVLTLLIGTVKTTVLNPISSALLTRFETMDSKYLEGRASLVAVSNSGLWLRQVDSFGDTVIHAERVSPDATTMYDVIIFLFEGSDRFVGRVDAARAVLRDGYWEVQEAWLTGPNRAARFLDEYRVQTELTPNQIEESFASPATVSFWDLPRFIKVLDKAGLSSVQHRLYLQSLLADPLLLCSMVLLAAAFSLRHTRRGATTMMIASGVGVAFLFYFFSDVVFALGLTASIPVALAAWAPAGASMLVGLTLLFYQEDG